MSYREKYLKYKTKYLELKQLGGNEDCETAKTNVEKADNFRFNFISTLEQDLEHKYRIPYQKSKISLDAVENDINAIKRSLETNKDNPITVNKLNKQLADATNSYNTWKEYNDRDLSAYNTQKQIVDNQKNHVLKLLNDAKVKYDELGCNNKAPTS